MASDDGLRTKVGKKLVLSQASMDLPEHLRHGADEEEDVTKPRGKNKEQYMHQSIFSMVTAAGHHGKRTDFISRFDVDPSESEEDAEGEKQSQAAHDGPSGSPSKSKHDRSDIQDPPRMKSRLLKSLPRLDKMRSRKDKRQASPDMMSSSQILTPKAKSKEGSEVEDSAEPDISNEAPVLSRMLTARAEMEAAQPTEETQESKDDVVVGTSTVLSPVSLAERLAEIFAFDEAETVIGEYPCWLLQTVLLQGYMYVTQRHVCFYAYLPKKDVSIRT
jgi:sterol 3beta-glucosyltransferase